MLITTPEEELAKLEHDKLILEKKIEIAKLKVELWYLEYELYYKELEKQPSIPWPIPEIPITPTVPIVPMPYNPLNPIVWTRSTTKGEMELKTEADDNASSVSI